MEISIFSSFPLFKNTDIWDVIVLNNKVDKFTDMTNQVSVSSQYFNWPGEPTFELFIVSNNDIGQEIFAI